MKFTLSWLKEYLDTDATLEQISQKLTIIGMEVESITDAAKDLSAFTVAHILEASPHPEAEKLQVCKVDTGNEILQIVCGAPNARPGLKVVLAPIGSIIPTNKMKIKASKIRNVESFGMLCSAAELGLGKDSDGIIELPQDAKIGDNFTSFLGLNDPVISVAITPNRGDCLGVYGIARDLAATGIGKLKSLTIPFIATSHKSPINVHIEHSSNCPLFVGYHIKNIANKPSPDWLAKRLQAIGQKPISAIVDITNYINYSFGRPLHAYDTDKLSGDITVRLAKANEKFTALNDKEYSLTETDIVVADAKEILGLAGIMGGKVSGAELSTSNIFLEAAMFDPDMIASSGRHHQIESDSRYRFERKPDHDFTSLGAQIAASMITSICGGEISEAIFIGNVHTIQRSFKFSPAKIQSLGGVTLSDDIIKTILLRLGFSIDNNWNIKIPSWRNDVEGEADIVEEVLRINGFDQIPMTLLPRDSMLTDPALSPELRRINLLRRMLAARGLNEVISWSFMSSSIAKQIAPINEALLLTNPIVQDFDYMRPSIIPNLISCVKKNAARGFTDLALFEIGPVFNDVTPNGQKKVIAGIRTGMYTGRSIYNDARPADLFDVKADIAAIMLESSIDFNKFNLTENAPSYYHPKRSACISLGKNIIGYFGELHPSFLRLMDIKTNAMAFEIFIDQVPIAKVKHGRKAPYIVSDYQAIERDFAFIVEASLAADQIVRSINATEKNLIKSVKVFDVYSGQGIEPGKKSVAVAVTLQAMDRTISDVESEVICKNIIDNVQKNTGGVLRG